MQTRIIPTLLLKGSGFVKTTRFKDPVYLGDPINILRIFNEKEVDEIAILDVDASVVGAPPNFELLRDLASECFMPLAYGGGVTSLQQIKQLFQIGFEKVILNTGALRNNDLIRAAADRFGSQSVVVCIDVKKSLLGRYHLVSESGRRKHDLSPAEWAASAAKCGAGELIVNSVDRDGTMSGYDLDLVRQVSGSVAVPVIASGGAASVSDFAAAVNMAHASACAAGAMFVFQGKHRAVLINVPSVAEIQRALSH